MSGKRSACNLDAPITVGCVKQTDIGLTRDQIFDEHQIGRVILDIEHVAPFRLVMHFDRSNDFGFDRLDHFLSFMCQVQFDPEYTAIADITFHADSAPPSIQSGAWQ